jgi:hypothetical protein
MAETVMDAPALRNEFAERIKSAWHKSREKIIALGRAIMEAKEHLPHGEFTAMIERDLPFGPDMAQQLMRIAKDPRFSDPAISPVLPASSHALDELRRLPDVEFQQAITDKRIHPAMTVAEARALARPETAQQAIEREASEPIDGQGDAPAGDQGLHEPAPVRDVINVATRRSAVSVVEPEDGVALNYGHLVAMLRKRRGELGMAQLEADERAGFESGYTGKLEQPNADYGRRAVHESFDVWLGAMRVGIRLVPLDEA